MPYFIIFLRSLWWLKLLWPLFLDLLWGLLAYLSWLLHRLPQQINSISMKTGVLQFCYAIKPHSLRSVSNLFWSVIPEINQGLLSFESITIPTQAKSLSAAAVYWMKPVGSCNQTTGLNPFTFWWLWPIFLLKLGAFYHK
jgi:hypothetical protein